MAVKPGSWVHHIVILWMSNGGKQFAGLLVCPDRRGASCFLVWRVMRIFFRKKNVGLPDYLILWLQATTLRFAVSRAALSAVGVLGRNRVYLANKYQYGRLNKGLLVPPWCGAVSDEAPRVEQIRELVRARDGLAPIDILEHENIPLVLEFITTYGMKCIESSGRAGSGLGWYVLYLIYHTALNNYCASITCTILCVLVANKYYIYIYIYAYITALYHSFMSIVKSQSFSDRNFIIKICIRENHFAQFRLQVFKWWSTKSSW